MPERSERMEFRQWAENQTRRHERIAGKPVAMARQCALHARLKARVWRTLDRAIRDAGLDCEAFGDGITIEIGEDTDYEPDAMVNAGASLDSDAFAADNPVIVVEVLSLSPQSIDSNDKLADYFRVPSIQHYLIVRARRREIIHYQRTGPDILSRPVNLGSLRLDPPGISIDIADIYDGTA